MVGRALPNDNLFGELQEKFGIISFADIWRMLRDHDIAEIFVSR